MSNTSLTYKYKMLHVAHKLIVINVLMFLLATIASFLFKGNGYDLLSWFTLPDEVANFIKQPWAFFTYGFIHFDFWHILFNMLWLHWVSQFILNIFNGKRFLTVFLLGIFFGGLLYVVSYNVFPVFETMNNYPLIGASAGVSALIIFMATYAPNTVGFRLFTWSFKLWHIALFLFLMDLVRLGTGKNPGGMLAHLGGAIFGYVYAAQLLKGSDIGIWFENILTWFSDLFKTRKEKPFKKVHRNKTTKTKKPSSAKKSDNQKKIDVILDKIGKSGYDSLTKAEKDFLFKAGKD